MKILLLADGMESGGAETHIQTLAEGLLAAGHTVGLASRGGKIADRLADAGVDCFSIPPIGQNPAAFLRARGEIARLTRKNGYEILHAHTRTSALLLRGICNPYMRKTQKMPVKIVTAHAKFDPSGFKGRVSYWGQATIAVSEDLRAHLADAFGLPAECVTVIPNGVDAARFSPVGKIPNEIPEILFVSRLEPDCSLGAELLCLAAANLAGKEGIPPFSVTVAGSGSRFADLSGLAGKINFALGKPLIRVVRPAAPDGILELCRRADLFVGVSRAAMEAAFCGAAVLLCGNEGYGGFLTPDRLDLAAANFCCRGEEKPTLERLSADLSRLLRHPEARQTAAAKTTAWLRREFSAAGMCRATEALYCRVLRRTAGEEL